MNALGELQNAAEKGYLTLGTRSGQYQRGEVQYVIYVVNLYILRDCISLGNAVFLIFTKG